MQIISAFILSLTCVQLYACNSNREMETVSNSNITANSDTMKLKVSVGSDVFTATLHDNATAAAFRAKLPVTIQMIELNLLCYQLIRK